MEETNARKKEKQNKWMRKCQKESKLETLMGVIAHKGSSPKILPKVKNES